MTEQVLALDTTAFSNAFKSEKNGTNSIGLDLFSLKPGGVPGTVTDLSHLAEIAWNSPDR